MKYVFLLLLLCSGLVCRGQNSKIGRDTLMMQEVKVLQQEVDDLRYDVRSAGNKMMIATVTATFAIGLAVGGFIVVDKSPSLARGMWIGGGTLGLVSLISSVSGINELSTAGAKNWDVGIGENGIGLKINFN
jgi:hypothetical protein